MMDLKEIIKWFFPGFNKYFRVSIIIKCYLTFVFLILLFNSCSGLEAKVNSVSEPNRTFLYDSSRISLNKSDYDKNNKTEYQIKQFEYEEKSVDESFGGRTFGRPFKKVIAGLIPVIFSMGAASAWAMVATLVGIKTFFVALLILKLLLVAGAAKIGALFGAKHHFQPHHEHKEWTPQKEIHLHIHNGQYGHHETHQEETYPAPWSRDGNPTASDTKSINVLALDQAYSGGPQTIITPYGNYVKVEPAKVRKRRSKHTSSSRTR